MSTNLRPPYSEFTASQTNLGENPDTAVAGTAITPGASNVMGSWTSLLAGTISENVYGIYIQIQNGQTAGVNGSRLMDIGIDPSGGTSYSVLIPYLMACTPNLADHSSGAGYVYYFPLFIPSGCTIAARAQQNNATPSAFRVGIRLMQKPTRPELVHVGGAVEAVGINAASSRGTVLTFAGTATDEGTWTSIGAPVYPGWYVVPSFGIDDASMTDAMYYADFALGDVTTKVPFFSDWWCGAGAAEETALRPMPTAHLYRSIPATTEIWARARCQVATPDSNFNVTMHVVR